MTLYDRHGARRDVRQRIAAWDMRCIHCGGVIYKGEPFEYYNGWRDMPEHADCCPTDPDERKQRGCRE